MEQQIEGSWEEVVEHADELSGKRVRVTVLSDSSVCEEKPLAELLEGLIGVIDSSKPSTPVAYKPSLYGEGIVGKFRKQGLKLP